MLNFIEMSATLAVIVYFFSRSPIGNRTPAGKWPRWIEKIGDRKIPSVVSSNWFFEIAWVCRRIMPIVAAFTVVGLWEYVTGGSEDTWLSGPDWLTILSLLLAFFAAATPFAKRPRRNPLDKWVCLIWGLTYAISGLVILVLAPILHYLHPAVKGKSPIAHVVMLAVHQPLDSILEVSAALIGFGVSLIALVEVLPEWRTGQNVVDSSKEIDELKAKNSELEKEIKDLHEKMRQRNNGRDKQKKPRGGTAHRKRKR